MNNILKQKSLNAIFSKLQLNYTTVKPESSYCLQLIHFQKIQDRCQNLDFFLEEGHYDPGYQNFVSVLHTPKSSAIFRGFHTPAKIYNSYPTHKQDRRDTHVTYMFPLPLK